MTDFRSDNEAPAAPEIVAALTAANSGPAHAYGDDAWSARLAERFGAVFETELVVCPVATGTAANALALAELAPPWGAVYCHPDAHANTDECGAPEFYTGGAKLVGVAGEHGKIDADALARVLAATGAHGEHEALPSALTLTQATEAGTVYAPEEVAALAAAARRHGLGVHMDGARLGNALAHLDCAPADATWRAGVDILSFGATKNGALAAEAVIDFRPGAGATLARRRKRGGHLWSKMRYLSAQLEACLKGGLWLRLAGKGRTRAPRASRRGLRPFPASRSCTPSNRTKCSCAPDRKCPAPLRAAGFEFHSWPGEDDAFRLVAPWCVEGVEIERFLACAAAAARRG